MALSKIAEALLFAPAFLWFFAGTLPDPSRVAWLVGIAAIGVGATYIALAAAYRGGNLSFVYPISRGSALLFLPLFGFAFLDERLGVLPAIGLSSIVAGILVMQLRDFSRDALASVAASLRAGSTQFAVLTGFVTALFTIWDKIAVRELHPFAYMYLYTSVVAAGYAWWAFSARRPPNETRDTWRGHRWAIVTIGVMNMVSYGLTLVALQQGVSSLVIGLRQVSIVLGVLMGWRLLGEPMPATRRWGVALIAVGCVAVALRD